ncbi:MAG TPA: hypothetical protein VHL54_13260 [Actinomycetota bacterium]|nr:hypothetical protein [Actinomycetota bacterium]
MLEDPASVWQRRRKGALVGLLMLGILVPTLPASADINMGVLSGFPTGVDAGDTNVGATVTVINASTAPDQLTTLAVNEISVVPSCSNFAANCAGGVADPDVFSFSATGTGVAGSACAGQTFNITEVDATTGRIQFVPTTGLPVLLAAPDIATDLDRCEISFTFNVLKAPNHDTLPGEPGASTNQVLFASAIAAPTGATATDFGEDIITVSGDTGPATPTLTTVASPSVPLGGQLTDTATLAGGNAPTGTISFSLFGPDNATCAPAAAFTTSVPVAGNGQYTSAAFTPTEPGVYRWVAGYSGDANNAAVATACGDPAETVTVTRVAAGPTITTVATPPTGFPGVSSDSATLTAPPGLPGEAPAPTGTITFQLFGPDNPTCNPAGPIVFTGTAAVDHFGAPPYGSGPSTAFTAAGTYHWVASYSGDANYPPAGPTACTDPAETFTFDGQGPAATTIVTAASPSVPVGGQIFDTATISGGNNPAGTIAFNLYGPDDADCSGTVAFTSSVPVSGNGAYQSGSFSPTQPGVYRWTAAYSGDANNQPASSACNAANESVTVTPVVVGANLTTQVAPATASVGQPIVDTATLSGGADPTGTITFNAYGPDDAGCTGTPVYTASVPVNGNGAYAATPPFVPAAPGTYRFIASYSGDAGNAPIAGECNAAGETATVLPLPTITVDKTASPASLPAPGGEFTFSVVLTNTSAVPLVITSLSDDVYGDLATMAGSNTCDDLIGDTLGAGASTAPCSFAGSFTGSEGQSQTDTVTAVAVDVAGNQATGAGTATVSLTAPAAPVPSVQADVTASPSSVPEPGGPVEYRVVITNTSNPVPLTITSLVDSFYGNLAALPEPNTCDALIGVVVQPGQSVSCEFTVQVAGDAGDTRTNTLTVTATAPDGTVVADTAAATVSFTDVLPEIEVDKVASPQTRPAPGGTFTFRVTIANTGAEAVLLTTLGDDVHGNLNGRGTCDTATTIAAGAAYACEFSVQFTGDEGDREVDTVLATVVDDEGNSVTEEDSESIRLTDPVGAAATPTPTVSPSPTASPTPTPTPSASASPTPTAGATPSPSASPTPAAAAPRPIVRTGADTLGWFAFAVALIALGSLVRRAAPSGRRSSGRRR